MQDLRSDPPLFAGLDDGCRVLLSEEQVCQQPIDGCKRVLSRRTSRVSSNLTEYCQPLQTQPPYFLQTLPSISMRVSALTDHCE